MDRFPPHLQDLRETAFELLRAWDSEPLLLPEIGLETEADKVDAAIYRTMMLDLRQSMRSHDADAFVAHCAKLVVHHRAVEGRALWCVFDDAALGQTRYGRTLSVLEQHLWALAHAVPTQETGATQP